MAFLLLTVFSLPAYCASDGTALLLQKTPPEGGTISPDVGIHSFAPRTEVSLTAVPRPGYQFVYWLGDVANPASNSTVVYLDSPKIVIAVFALAEYQLLTTVERSESYPGGGLISSAGDYSSGGFGGGGGVGESSGISISQPPEQKEDKFPVPPAPEPSTFLLFAAGAGLLLSSRRRPAGWLAA